MHLCQYFGLLDPFACLNIRLWNLVGKYLYDNQFLRFNKISDNLEKNLGWSHWKPVLFIQKFIWYLHWFKSDSCNSGSCAHLHAISNIRNLGVQTSNQNTFSCLSQYSLKKMKITEINPRIKEETNKINWFILNQFLFLVF